MLNKKQALQLIEELVSSDAIQDLEYKVTVKKTATEDEKFYHNKLTTIYKIAHATLGECGNPHTDWKEECELGYKLMFK